MGRVGPVVIAIVLAGWLAHPAADSSAAVGSVLERFLTRADEPVTQFRGTRHLEAQNDRFSKEATMDVVAELVDGHFTYNVLKETGSETIRRRAMRGLLENEVEQASAKDPSRFAVTPANYTLLGGEVADDGTVKLLAKPRRKEVGMVDGAVFVTSTDADIVRVEGRMVKTPSFWTTRVDVVKRYARIAGVRVPVRLDTTAHVRFAGTSTMSMTYHYEMVNGREVSQ
jgi:hypothetical protein